MSLFSYTMNHRAGLHRYQGTNPYGDALYSPTLGAEPEAFACRFEYNRAEVLDKDGNKVISEAKLITTTPIKPLDIIRYDGEQWTVKACTRRDDALGNIDHWEVRL